MRLAVDEMLQGLGRWLRAAGYDTLVAQGGMDDRALLDACRADGRVLVTRDRALAERGRDVRVVVLPAGGLGDDVRALNAALEIDWGLAPFTRCLEDNTPLRPATEAEVMRMPATAQTLPGPLLACPACGRLYWPGSHVRRMRARLDAFARGEAGVDETDQLSATPGVRT